MSEDYAAHSVELATELTVAWLGNQNNRITAAEVPTFLQAMHTALNELASGSQAMSDESAQSTHTPAVSVRKSLTSRDHIISMIDGKPYKTLRRHLGGHGLTPEQYRERYNLKHDYPMVAPSYSEARRDMAKRIGLGNKGRGGNSGAGKPKSAPAQSKPGAPKRS